MTYLRFPEAHHRRIRTTNRLERLNGESRRRTNVIPRFPTERACLIALCKLGDSVQAMEGVPRAKIAKQLHCVHLAQRERRRRWREGMR